jgi:hypothetical protein
MLFRAATALALLAATAQASTSFMISERELFGLQRRDNGYQPTQTFCGMGSTCAEACGKGFEMCPSTDNAIHCYNLDVKQVCCSDMSGSMWRPGRTQAGSAC